MAYETISAAERGVTTWQITARLQWQGAVLMQAWQCLENGKVEWRPVPAAPFLRSDGDQQP